MYNEQLIQEWEAIKVVDEEGIEWSYKGDADLIYHPAIQAKAKEVREPTSITDLITRISSGAEQSLLGIRPTMKELQLSKGIIWKPNSKFGKEMQRKTGIKPKGTHFKMDVGMRKVALNELTLIHAKDDAPCGPNVPITPLNDYSQRLQLMAVPVKMARKRAR